MQQNQTAQASFLVPKALYEQNEATFYYMVFNTTSQDEIESMFGIQSGQFVRIMREVFGKRPNIHNL